MAQDTKREPRHILVTGANGFVGQHLVNRLLQNGLAVRVLIRDTTTKWSWGGSVEVARGDVRNPLSLSATVAGIDSVFHLAGKVHDFEELEDSGEHEEVTLKGTQNLLSAARESGVKRFVFFSSLSVYGRGSRSAQDETSACEPVSAYGRAKLWAEQYLLSQGVKSGIKVCCLRLATVYGPGCKGNLPRMIRMIDLGLFPPLPNVGNRRSMVHVSNAVEAAMLALNHPAANGQCYNVTDAKPYSTRELYEMIRQGLGKRVPRWHIPVWVLIALGRVGDAFGRVHGKRFWFDSDALEKLIGSAWYSSEKISRELGYHPSITFEDTLPEIIDWYRKVKA